MVGLGLENALHELQNVGDEKQPKYEPRYTLDQLLHPDFRLPSTDIEVPDFGALAGIEGISLEGF
jgi:hypothetical protein